MNSIPRCLSPLILKYLGSTSTSSEYSSINCHEYCVLVIHHRKYWDGYTERTKFMLGQVTRATARKCTVDGFGYPRLSSALFGLIIDHDKYVWRELQHSNWIPCFLPKAKKKNHCHRVWVDNFEYFASFLLGDSKTRPNR